MPHDYMMNNKHVNEEERHPSTWHTGSQEHKQQQPHQAPPPQQQHPTSPLGPWGSGTSDPQAQSQTTTAQTTTRPRQHQQQQADDSGLSSSLPPESKAAAESARLEQQTIRVLRPKFFLFLPHRSVSFFLLYGRHLGVQTPHPRGNAAARAPRRRRRRTSGDLAAAPDRVLLLKPQGLVAFRIASSGQRVHNASIPH
jgi:hypothetical protein